MPMLRAIRTMNNLEAGTLSGSALQTLLADTGRLGDFVSLVTQRGHARRLAASSTAMTAVAASSTAMAAVIASPTAMAAVAASSTAMAAVIASSTAMAAVIASSTAMAAVFASSTAMAAIGASNTALAAIGASNTALADVFASSTARVALYDHATALATLTAIANVQTYLKTIDVQASTNNTAHTSANTGRTLLVTQWGGGVTVYAGASDDAYSTVSTVDRFVKVMNLTHRTSNGGFASFVTYIDMD